MTDGESVALVETKAQISDTEKVTSLDEDINALETVVQRNVIDPTETGLMDAMNDVSHHLVVDPSMNIHVLVNR